MPLERGEMSPPSRPHHPHIAMSDCIVNVTGGELPAKEIEAYKKRAVEKFGEMPRQIDIKVDASARSTASTTPSAPRSTTA